MTFARRQFFMRTEQARESAIALLRNLPLDAAKPLQITVEEYRPARKLDQNSLMWAGPLRDIAEQAWLDGKKYSAEVWAHYFKVQLLPEEFDPELVKDTYQKWGFDPAGDRVLIGSTTQLTIKGMAQHIEAIHAFGASLGVQFHTKGQ